MPEIGNPTLSLSASRARTVVGKASIAHRGSPHSSCWLSIYQVGSPVGSRLTTSMYRWCLERRGYGPGLGSPAAEGQAATVTGAFSEPVLSPWGHGLLLSPALLLPELSGVSRRKRWGFS